MPSFGLSALDLFAHRLHDLSPLEAGDIDKILALPVRVAQTRANIDIVPPGQAPDHACLIVDGLVARFGQLRDGQRQITAVHIPGDVADLHAVATPGPGRRSRRWPRPRSCAFHTRRFAN